MTSAPPSRSLWAPSTTRSRNVFEIVWETYANNLKAEASNDDDRYRSVPGHGRGAAPAWWLECQPSRLCERGVAARCQQDAGEWHSMGHASRLVDLRLDEAMGREGPRLSPRLRCRSL